MTFDLHIITAAVITLFVGWFMATAGVQKSALEWKRRRRICPSCGHEAAACICNG